MSPQQRRPDLGNLSPEAKDDLIRDLWKQLASLQSELRVVRRRSGLSTPTSQAEESGELLTRLREAAPRKTSLPSKAVAVSLGRVRGVWDAPAVLGLVAFFVIAFAVDGGIGWYQTRLLEQQKQERLQLENAAFTSLYVELRRITYESDGESYRLTLTMQNIDPERPLYVMLNPVRIFIQSGLVWKEVPSSPAPGTTWGVVKVSDSFSYDVIFKANVENWAELIPGYMHVRVEDDMLISQSAEPVDDIVGRRNPFYVYLKPHDSDDGAIKMRSKMQGKPPVFIPMPPH